MLDVQYLALKLLITLKIFNRLRSHLPVFNGGTVTTMGYLFAPGTNMYRGNT